MNIENIERAKELFLRREKLLEMIDHLRNASNVKIDNSSLPYCKNYDFPSGSSIALFMIESGRDEAKRKIREIEKEIELL